MQLFRVCFYIIIILLLMESCQTVKPYQRVYLNDNEMQMGSDAGGTFEQRVQDIREGAYPAGSATKSGSCGCN